MKKKKSPILILIVFALSLFLGLGYVFYYLTCTEVDKSSSEKIDFSIEKGQSLTSIVSALKKAGLIRSEKIAYYIARIKKTAFKAGSYRLSKDMKLNEILAELTTGKQRYIKVTIAEGLTITKLARLLESASIVNADKFIQLARSGEALKAYGINAKSCEGFLFPDTYFFSENETAESVLNLLIKTFFKKVHDIEDFPRDGAKILETVKLASIVEREYRLESEAARIAGVFLNRLKRNMRLESCTTIEYIITEIQHKEHPKRIFWVDLEIDSPYNTYIHAGLPPTAICSPGLVALKAVVKAETHDYLYFRLVNEKSGEHSFSKTFSEHSRKAEGFKTKGF